MPRGSSSSSCFPFCLSPPVFTKCHLVLFPSRNLSSLFRPLLRFFVCLAAGHRWSPLVTAGHRWLVTVASAARFTSRSALTTRTRRTKGARSQRSGCCCCCCCRRRCCCRCPLPACLGGRRRRRRPLPRTPAKKRMSQRPASQAPPAARSDLISNKKYLPQLIFKLLYY